METPARADWHTEDWEAYVEELTIETERYRKALERIRNDIPPNEHKKWHHHHYYYYIANTALKGGETKGGNDNAS